MKRIIDRAVVSDVDELIEALKVMGRVSNAYVTINSDSIRLALVEETLTDGSIVYNIELSPACESF